MAAVGRKRKIDQVHGSSGRDSVKKSSGSHRDGFAIPDSMRNIRTTMAQLKNATPQQISMSKQIEMISAKVFPRKEEWIVTYLSQVLAKGNLSVADSSSVWTTLANIVQSLPRDTSKNLLRKVDLLVRLHNHLTMVQHEHEAAAIQEISTLLLFLSQERGTKKLLLSSPEKACACFVSALSSEHQGQEAMISILAELILYNGKQRVTEKKLLELVRETCVPPIVHYLCSNEALPAIVTLLQSTVFCESGYTSTLELEAILRRCQGERGMLRLCQISFLAANKVLPNSLKLLAARNALLKTWLAVLAIDDTASLFNIYRDTLLGNVQNRALSSDENLLEILNSRIDAILARSEHTQVLTTLLTLDLDVLYPKYETSVWARIERENDDQLLLGWLQVYIKIRALPSFFTCLSRFGGQHDGLLNETIMNLMAEAIQNQSLAVQLEITTIILKCSPLLKDALLSVLVAGAAHRPPVLERLSSTIEESTDPRLLHMWSIHVGLKYAAKPREACLQSITGREEAETWLRSVELDNIATETKTQNLCIVNQCLQLAANDLAFLQALIVRWCDILSKVLTASQIDSFIDIVFNASTLGRPWLAHAHLLEQQRFHSAIQRRLQNVEDRLTLQMILLIPVRFLHNAVRRTMVQRLLESTTPSSEKYQVLLKYAKADVLPTFAEAQTFMRFAVETIRSTSIREVNDGLFTQGETNVAEDLRRAYIKTLPVQICLDILHNPDCPASLKAEILLERQSEDIRDTEMLNKLTQASIENLIAATDIAADQNTDLAVLCKLLPLEHDSAKTISARETIDTQSWLKIAQQPMAEDSKSRLFEIAAWHARTAEDAQHILAMSSAVDAETQDKVITALLAAISKDELGEVLTRERHASTAPAAIQNSQILRVLSISKHDHFDSEWWSYQISTQCNSCLGEDLAHSKTVLEFVQTVVLSHKRAVKLSVIDEIFLLINRITTRRICINPLFLEVILVLRTVFQHHAHLMRDRYHFIILAFQKLLAAVVAMPEIEVKKAVEVYVRLFETFLASCRALSTTPERFDRAIAKHVPWLLIDYVSIVTESGTKIVIPADAKQILEESLIYEIMSLCGIHEREMMANSLNAAGRGMFKRLYEDWNRFGKWTEK